MLAPISQSVLIFHRNGQRWDTHNRQTHPPDRKPGSLARARSHLRSTMSMNQPPSVFLPRESAAVGNPTGLISANDSLQ